MKVLTQNVQLIVVFPALIVQGSVNGGFPTVVRVSRGNEILLPTFYLSFTSVLPLFYLNLTSFKPHFNLAGGNSALVIGF